MVTDKFGLVYLVKIKMGNFETNTITYLAAENNGVCVTWGEGFLDKSELVYRRVKGGKIFRYKGELGKPRRLFELDGNVYIQFKIGKGLHKLVLYRDFCQNAIHVENKQDKE